MQQPAAADCRLEVMTLTLPVMGGMLVTAAGSFMLHLAGGGVYNRTSLTDCIVKAVQYYADHLVACSGN